jgi:hypothetical protein
LGLKRFHRPSSILWNGAPSHPKRQGMHGERIGDDQGACIEMSKSNPFFGVIERGIGLAISSRNIRTTHKFFERDHTLLTNEIRLHSMMHYWRWRR